MTMSDEARIEFPMRLNRYIALCGIAARRKAERLIISGRVTVGNVVELSPGRVLSGPEEVRVDGIVIGCARGAYIVMNKPRGVLSAVSDAREQTVLDLLPDFYRSLGVFPVGRLDSDSEGLMILTNDGKFAHKLMHPSSGVKKTYIVFLRHVLERKQMMEWTRGVIIEGRVAKPLEISPAGDGQRCVRIVLEEGFKREIRLMAKALGNRVVRLQRIGIGALFLKKLPLGAFCEYNYEDLQNMLIKGGEV
ncbi:MAG: rRNA pseudouridine synthase [Synergistaceae bacterium]|jgi:23S rRNA pseudouridine2605 synthase|nr:rRNA pseudouridine synthase [Synergistaceae bacterium]